MKIEGKNWVGFTSLVLLTLLLCFLLGYKAGEDKWKGSVVICLEILEEVEKKLDAYMLKMK